MFCMQFMVLYGYLMSLLMTIAEFNHGFVTEYQV